MAIHQLLVSASPGDAVTDAAFGFRRALRRIGPSEIYAAYNHDDLAGDVRPLPDLERCGGPDDLVVYHASIGEARVAQFLREWVGRVALVYHNITPARYFDAVDPRFAALLRGGRRELELLRDKVELALAVSSYNAAELETLGYRDVRISPLPVDLDRLAALAPDSTVSERLAERHGPLVLFVGQLLPHKRPDLLVAAFHVLSTYLLPEAHLALVGAGPLPRYAHAVRRQARELFGGRTCHVPGWQTPAALAAYYRAADLFATMSEHEGVCVPLLEAMRFDVPTCARAFGAIPETVGTAGVVLPAEDDPVLVAEALFELLTNDALRATLTARGRDRARRISAAQAEATFLSHLADVA